MVRFRTSRSFRLSLLRSSISIKGQNPPRCGKGWRNRNRRARVKWWSQLRIFEPDTFHSFFAERRKRTDTCFHLFKEAATFPWKTWRFDFPSEYRGKLIYDNFEDAHEYCYPKYLSNPSGLFTEYYYPGYVLCIADEFHYVSEVKSRSTKVKKYYRLPRGNIWSGITFHATRFRALITNSSTVFINEEERENFLQIAENCQYKWDDCLVKYCSIGQRCDPNIINLD